MMPKEPIESIVAAGASLPLIAPKPRNLGNIVLPSFHRPALLNYYRNGMINEPNLVRKVLLRPSWFDHPNFSGSNPEYNIPLSAFRNDSNDTAAQEALIDRMIYGPWDVDNDNDGVRDSVWVDFGAPIMSTPDGRRVKPLAAMLVLDLDGRANVNVHGTVEHSRPGGNGSGRPIAKSLATGSTSNTPRGQGYGPADIMLGPVFGFQNTLLNNIFHGTPETPGRYGYLPDDDWDQRLPGDHTVSDLLAQIKMQGVPYTVTTTDSRPSAFETPPDFHCRYGLGLNSLGQPVYEAVDDLIVPLNWNTPYELNLSLNSSFGMDVYSLDAPYSVAELERLLRAYDTDASLLPSRIWEFSGLESDPTSIARRNLVTTDSFDLPVPSVTVPQWMIVGPDETPNTNDDFIQVMNKPAANATFSDLLEYRVRLTLGFTRTPDEDPANRARVHAVMKGGPIKGTDGNLVAFRPLLVGQDLFNGTRLDINRPMGNGRDDNNNGVVDEPGEWEDVNGNGVWDPEEGEAPYWEIRGGDSAIIDDSDSPQGQFTTSSGSIRDEFDRDGNGEISDEERVYIDRDNDGTIKDRERLLGDINYDGTVNQDDFVLRHNLRRQELARDLFVLAITLVEPIDTTSNEGKAEVRKLAQWAINCVDFSDPDNIMTAFEYDESPFNGWDTDGNLATDDNGSSERAVVWGTEKPELLITETLGWHDRRTEDGGEEINTGAIEGNEQVGPEEGDDSDFDQEHRPQGAGFVELYNPWPESPTASSDVRDMSGGVDQGVNIGAMDASNTNPVWRLSVYKTVNTVVASNIGGPHLDPDAPDINNRARGADRTIYFAGAANLDPNGDGVMDFDFPDDGVGYFSSLATPQPVPPGGYFVAGTGEFQNGSRYTTPFGVKKGDDLDIPVTRGIVLDTALGATRAVCVALDNGNSLQDQADFACDANSSYCSVAVINRPIHFSFSEPPGGYILKDGNQFVSGVSAALDTPLDDQRSGGFGLGGAPADDLAASSRDGENRLKLPVQSEGGGVSDEQSARRTIPGFSWVYLQRLANPLLPWNPEPDQTGHDPDKVVNPYLTVDSMGVNVTVFNGLADTETRKVNPGAEQSELYSYDNGDPVQPGDAVDTFASLQRGRVNRSSYLTDSFINNSNANTLLIDLQLKAKSGNAGSSGSRPADPHPATPPQQADFSPWGPELLGRISVSDYANAGGNNPPNIGLWRNRAGRFGNGGHDNDGEFNFKAVPDCTLGFLNEPFRSESAATEDERKRIPARPFPWLNWNNRPFISGNEVIQVPSYRSSQLLQSFGFNFDGSQTENYAQTDTPMEIKLSDSNILKTDGPYGHLMNFFRTEKSSNGRGIVGMHRILDYLHVPSRFVGTETWLNPQAFSAFVEDTSDPRYGLQPPLNRVATFREPGRVNLNTIAASEVWYGMQHGLPQSPNAHPGPFFDRANTDSILLSRRGYTSPAIEQEESDFNRKLPFTLHDEIPTFFQNPFRAADATDLVPIPSLLAEDSSQLENPTPTPRQPVQATLLRENSANGQPFFTSSRTVAHSNANRNAYFRYQPMTRLDNLTTTRSHVYAVWITVGFFEVEEFDENNPQHKVILQRYGDGSLAEAAQNTLFNRIYPEGYMIGREAGLDTGEVERVREFAIIDRSIPVAFEPGADHNVDEVIRLRRRIE